VDELVTAPDIVMEFDWALRAATVTAGTEVFPAATAPAEGVVAACCEVRAWITTDFSVGFPVAFTVALTMFEAVPWVESPTAVTGVEPAGLRLPVLDKTIIVMAAATLIAVEVSPMFAAMDLVTALPRLPLSRCVRHSGYY